MFFIIIAEGNVRVSGVRILDREEVSHTPDVIIYSMVI